MERQRWALLIFCLLTLTAIGLPMEQVLANVAASGNGSDWPQISLVPLPGQVASPMHITHAADGSNRLFVVERAGRIRIYENGALLPTPFLDISARTTTDCERGLLSLAFPPDYNDKGYFYVNYTDLAGHTNIARYFLLPGEPNIANADSEEILLTIEQPYCNHNGGQIAFSPVDNYLYIGMGDGGSGGDPQNRAQTPSTLLGKMLRIDSESDPGRETYLVPPTNPYTQTTSYRSEIWALGLRNPWRFSFDALTGDLFIADVGQNSWEEINFQPASSPGGENWGWRLMEGMHCFIPSTGCNPGKSLNLPVWEYPHGSDPCSASVTGGEVYRGDRYPRMQGMYFYADYCTGEIWALDLTLSGWQNVLMEDFGFNITTFGSDETGQLYLADASGGTIYRVEDTVTSTGTPTVTTTGTATLTPTRTPIAGSTSSPTPSPTTTRSPTPSVTPTPTHDSSSTFTLFLPVLHR